MHHALSEVPRKRLQHTLLIRLAQRVSLGLGLAGWGHPGRDSCRAGSSEWRMTWSRCRWTYGQTPSTIFGVSSPTESQDVECLPRAIVFPRNIDNVGISHLLAPSCKVRGGWQDWATDALKPLADALGRPLVLISRAAPGETRLLNLYCSCCCASDVLVRLLTDRTQPHMPTQSIEGSSAALSVRGSGDAEGGARRSVSSWCRVPLTLS